MVALFVGIKLNVVQVLGIIVISTITDGDGSGDFTEIVPYSI